LVAEFLASRGFEDVTLVGQNHQTGADIYASHLVDSIGIRHRYFVEVKKWKEKVGIEVINTVYGAMMGEKDVFGWTCAMIVSPSGFSETKRYGGRFGIEKKGIYLKGRDDLTQWLDEYKPSNNGLWLPDPKSKELIIR